MSRNIPIKIERNENTPTFYAESIQLLHNLSGFKMVVFNDEADYEKDAKIGRDALMPRKIIKKIVAEINFSPQQLKIIQKLIDDQIKAYERNFGEINLPDKGPKKGNTAGTYI